MNKECIIGILISFMPILIAMYCWYKFLDVNRIDFHKKIDKLRRKIQK